LDKSAAVFCHEVAALVSDMLFNNCQMKNRKIVNNSATTEAGEEISTAWEYLEFLKNFDVCLTKLKKSNFIFKN
jgi:hypothetical protein